MIRTRSPDQAASFNSRERIAKLEERIAKLEKIKGVLMDRVERSVDHQANAYSLFQTAIDLERQVKKRADDLAHTLRRLKQTNEELTVAKDMAERANRSKTRFLIQASHDLFQPLNAAGLAISALAEIQHDDRGLHLTHQVERALTNIEGLLKTLLDISKLDAGIMVPQTTTVALGELLSELGADYAPWAVQRKLDLRVRATSVYVSTDPSMFSRILHNLVSNALRYTEKGRILVGVRRRPTSVRVDIFDTGPGIPQDQYAMIFEEFHRGRGPAAGCEIGPGLGLGLGLSIVQRLVDALGYRLSLRSQVGHGTCFSIEVPRVARPAMSPSFALHERPNMGWGLSGACVVVIDNEKETREAISELILRWHCEVIQASSGEEASHVISVSGRRPDLLLVDYHLDAETALEAVAALHANHGSDIAVIVITGDYDDEVEDRVTAAGMDLLRKPVKPAELRALMAHLLE
jgi:two-component system, sensor histidine kinase